MIAENISLLVDDMYAELVSHLDENLSGKPSYITEYNLKDLTTEQLNDLSESLVDKLTIELLENPSATHVEISISITSKSEITVEENLVDYINLSK
jgi:gamma-glutamyl phosphate reductase